MNLGRYRLLAQLGAGADGISYRVCDASDQSPAEVRILSGARTDPGRWKLCVKRLRLTAMLDHPAATRVRALELDHDPPYVVMEWLEGPTLAKRPADVASIPVPQRMVWTEQLTSALLAAHRLGLAHGRVWPSQLHVTPDGKLKTDFTGLETGATANLEEHAALDAACRAPGKSVTTDACPADDVYSLGALLRCWFIDRAAALDQLIAEMTAPQPADRPSLADAADRLIAVLPGIGAEAGRSRTGDLAATGEMTAAPGTTVVPDSEAAMPTAVSMHAAGAGQRLGRFRLLEKLGEGGMGAVFRAEDIADGTVVAIKVLATQHAARPDALRRFHKEARLLAEVNNPYVANLLEVNEDRGVHFLAMEFVAGRSLQSLLEQCGSLDERLALSIVADVARALVDAHQRGIVHRDIKPGNILLVPPNASGPLAAPDSPLTTHHSPAAAPRVKLTDFGLARHVVESESLAMTRTGAILGTPFYMAPEQCGGTGSIDPRTDVYAIGATLFHLLAGRPPFLADNPMQVIAMHSNEPPPALEKLRAGLSDGVCQIVAKCLAKHPDARYAAAGALLRDIERLLRGEPTSIAVHPKLPASDRRKTLQYDFTWTLEASPQQLWPHVSNTERLNRAVGLSAVQFTSRDDPKRGVRRFGQMRAAGMPIAWEEHPFEWIEARRMGVLREFTQGPFKWFVSVVELLPRAGGGTTLTHSVRIEPRGLLGRTVAAVEVGVKARRSLERVYRRIDAAVTGKLGSTADPFEEPAALSAARLQRLDRLADRLVERSIDPAVAERLVAFIAEAPDQAVARIRPLALARRLGLDSDQVAAACLNGAREGLLVLLWDILCPICRIPSEVKDTLRALREHGHCDACNLDFELDFANSVEMIFRVHPEIRDVELGTYCIGGPAHSPHVVAQVRVGPGERIELELALGEGAYRLRGPQLPFAIDFRVQPSAGRTLWEADLARAADPDRVPILKAGGQVLALTNEHDQELLVRIERTAPRHDALTAARASSLALFRELFPDEILSPGQLVSVATVTLLVTDLDGAGGLYRELGDARAFGLIHEHFRLVNDRIRGEGGALVKTVGEGLLAAFSDSAAAVRAALDLQSVLAGSAATRELRLRVGVHRGEAMAATLNDRLDYFGTVVNVAWKLPSLASGGELILTQAVAADPQVAALLSTRNLQSQLLNVDLPGLPTGPVHRIVLPGGRPNG